MSFLKCRVCHSLRVALYLSWIVFLLGTYPVQASDHLDTAPSSALENEE
jgi:hypothetical protein